MSKHQTNFQHPHNKAQNGNKNSVRDTKYHQTSFVSKRKTKLTSIALLPLLALAQIIPASTFYLPQTGTIFSLNVDNSSQDITFHFSSPAKSWVAIGTGDKMGGSLIFFMYFNHNSSSTSSSNNAASIPIPNSKLTNIDITFSPRIATGEKEPKYAPEIDVDLLSGTGVVNSTFITNAVCHNCRFWKGGSLDVTSTSQPFMYAFGPSNPLASSDLSAALVQHSHIGTSFLSIFSPLYPHYPPFIPTS
jgi:hypothetical protein